MRLSECREYFTNEKEKKQFEVIRLQGIILDLENQITKLETKYNNSSVEHLRSVARYENIIAGFSKKVENDFVCQTEINMEDLEKMKLTYEISSTNSRLNNNKILDCLIIMKSKIKNTNPISLSDLKSLIADVYMKKIKSNFLNMLLLPNKRVIQNFDEFFYSYMMSKYKISSIAEDQIERALITLLNNTGTYHNILITY